MSAALLLQVTLREPLGQLMLFYVEHDVGRQAKQQAAKPAGRPTGRSATRVLNNPVHSVVYFDAASVPLILY